MRTETKTSRYLEAEDKAKFYQFLEEHDLRIGEVAYKLNVSYVYLTVILNGKRAFTKKLEDKLSAIGFRL